ncbi:hypothetical protein [Streptomyces sp. GZWMJZ-114]|uniref:hypothetical protein n=1 Tax=Streptomyces sp. GZWMJZ-114 TaxID=2494734 RepID=UPI001010C3C8|nr:hypothetical protein [Streptomyces sp. GZWMJZ-114]
MNLRGRRQRNEEGEPGTPAAPGSRRPRGATTLLLVAAAVLGLGGGTAYGYHVQADRHPKPLPPLAQSGLSYPKKALPADAKGSRPPLEENQDHQLVYRGGLDRLLLPLPKGWRQDEEGHKTFGEGFDRSGDLALNVYDYVYPAEVLEEELVGGFARIAGDDWSGPGELSGQIRLVDYAPRSRAQARNVASDRAGGITMDETYQDVRTLNGPPGVRIFTWKEPAEAGYAPSWSGRVIGSRGSVLIDLTFWDNKPLDEKLLMGLAKKQWERL